MKVKSRHITLYKIVLTIMAIVIVGEIFVWDSKSISTIIVTPSQESTVVSTPKTGEGNNVINRANETPTPTTGNYGNTDLIFNQDYQSPYRRFSFKYPPAFQIADTNSASVYLENDGKTLLLIDEDSLLTSSSDGKTAHEQFEDYYLLQKKIDENLPDLTTIKRIDFDENNFVYKFTEVHEKTSPGLKIAGQDEWNHYLGVLKGNGVSVYDLKRLPEDIVLEIIQSIEFDQNVQN